MICAIEKTQMQLPLVGSGEQSGESPNHQQKSPPPAATLRTPEAVKEYHRKYYQEHKAEHRAYCRAEYRRNIDRYRRTRGTEEYKAKARAVSREWREENPERQKASMKRWSEENKEHVAEYKKAYAPRRRELYQENKVEIVARKCELAKTPKNRERVRRYCAKKRREDIQFALMGSLRASMNRAFRRNGIMKSARTEVLMGCTINEAMAHLEAQFSPGMSWKVRSSFVVDHVLAIAWFDLRDPEEQRVCFNYRNLQPLTPHANSVKSATVTFPLAAWLPSHIALRVEGRAGGRVGV
jgi:hypothetical protein